MSDKQSHTAVVLLVEDDPDDIWSIEQLFAEHHLRAELAIVHDGESASAFVRRQGRFSDAPRPDLILLDLNLPKKNGREFLAELKAEPELADIPVVVLTTSQSEDDIIRACNLDCHSYISKPLRFDHLMMLFKSLDGFELRLTVRNSETARNSEDEPA